MATDFYIRAIKFGDFNQLLTEYCMGPLSECHVAFLCPAMEDFRRNNTDIMTFITMCHARSIHPRIAYKWYVTGLDWKDENIPTLAYLQRGQTLQKLLSEWLRRT